VGTLSEQAVEGVLEHSNAQTLQPWWDPRWDWTSHHNTVQW